MNLPNDVITKRLGGMDEGEQVNATQHKQREIFPGRETRGKHCSHLATLREKRTPYSGKRFSSITIVLRILDSCSERVEENIEEFV